MPKPKFYAVKTGRTPGIYFTWEDCKKQVDGFEKAEYKSFTDVTTAYEWMFEKEEKSDAKTAIMDAEQGKTEVKASVEQASVPAVDIPDGPYAFVDGSFNPETQVYGYGGFLCVNGRKYPLEGSGVSPDMASMRNVAGEIEGLMAAVRKAEELKLRTLTILYDYRGIEAWARGGWKTTKDGTTAYAEFMKPDNRSVDITFQKVVAHTGIEGNEMADVMAKHAVGVALTKKGKVLYEQAYAVSVRDGYDVENTDSLDEEMHYE